MQLQLSNSQSEPNKIEETLPVINLIVIIQVLCHTKLTQTSHDTLDKK